MNEVLEILLFTGGYNTNLVLLSALLLGGVAGVVGSFIYLRGRTLISDAVSHATLPGVALGFLVAYNLGIDGGRFLPALLIGAAFTGALAALSVQWISHNTRLGQDSAIGSVLSIFYAGGIVLLSYIQRLEGAAQAGLDTFLLGQVTGISSAEITVIFILSLLILLACILFIKPLKILCFDSGYAKSIGLPVTFLDILLIGLMLAVVCAGLRTVGLILILALLIIPPVTARFWTNDFKNLLIASSAIGAVSAFIGAVLSARLENLPAGGAMVLCAAAIFSFSFIFAPNRGVVAVYCLQGRGK